MPCTREEYLELISLLGDKCIARFNPPLLYKRYEATMKLSELSLGLFTTGLENQFTVRVLDTFLSYNSDTRRIQDYHVGDWWDLVPDDKQAILVYYLNYFDQ